MNLLFFLIQTLSSILTLYMFLCLIRVFLTWVPSLAYSAFGRFLSRITDPWLNIFRKFNPMGRFGVDISPIFAFAVLMVLSSIFQQISTTKIFSIGSILSIVLTMSWSIASSLLTFLNIIVLIRLIAHLFNKNEGHIWQSIDQLLYPITQKIAITFSRNRSLKRKYSLIIILVLGFALQYGGGYVIAYISAFISHF